MAIHKVSNRYARSLMGMASTNNAVEQVKADVLLLDAVLTQNNDLESMLESPIINSGKKLAVMKAVFEGKVDTMTMRFLEVVIAKKREGLLQEIANEFIKQYNTANNISSVTVVTAVPLNEESKKQIHTFIEEKTGQKITLKTEVKPDIIGGIVIRLEDRLYDASISHQLKTIKKELLSTYISKN